MEVNAMVDHDFDMAAADGVTEEEPQVTFTIPGSSRRLILEGSPGNEILAFVREASISKCGCGYRATVTMPAYLAQQLSDYLYSVEGVVGDMTGAEREGGREAEKAWKARAAVDFELAALDGV